MLTSYCSAAVHHIQLPSFKPRTRLVIEADQMKRDAERLLTKDGFSSSDERQRKRMWHRKLSQYQTTSNRKQDTGSKYEWRRIYSDLDISNCFIAFISIGGANWGQWEVRPLQSYHGAAWFQERWRHGGLIPASHTFTGVRCERADHQGDGDERKELNKHLTFCFHCNKTSGNEVDSCWVVVFRLLLAHSPHCWSISVDNIDSSWTRSDRPLLFAAAENRPACTAASTGRVHEEQMSHSKHVSSYF